MPEDNAEQQKPVGPFEDIEACVRHFEGDEEVDDPEALCGWMEENAGASAVQEYTPSEDEVQDLVEAMKEPAASSVLTNLEVTYVSGVGDPAQDSQWVMAKDATDQGADWGVTAPLVLAKGHVALADDEGDEQPDEAAQDEEQKAWAPVLIPNETDKQGDVIPPEAIEKAAHGFLAEARNVDTDHDLLEGKGTPIESWTLKEETTFTLPDGSESREYPKGTWMMGVEFIDKAWERVKSGELTGFSIYGEATEHDVQDLLGGGVDLEMGTAPTQFQATAKEADSGTENTMGDTENEPDEGTENEAKDGEGTEGEQPEGGEDQPTLKDIQDTVENTNETVSTVKEQQEQHADRLDALEDEVFEKDTEGEGGEDGEGEATEADLDEVKDEATQEATDAATEAAEETAAETAEAKAEEQVKNLLGIEGDLPEDEDERQEVVRKHLHEQPEDDGGLGSPDDWGEDEVNEVVK